MFYPWIPINPSISEVILVTPMIPYFWFLHAFALKLIHVTWLIWLCKSLGIVGQECFTTSDRLPTTNMVYCLRLSMHVSVCVSVGVCLCVLLLLVRGCMTFSIGLCVCVCVCVCSDMTTVPGTFSALHTNIMGTTVIVGTKMASPQFFSEIWDDRNEEWFAISHDLVRTNPIFYCRSPWVLQRNVLTIFISLIPVPIASSLWGHCVYLC